MKRLQRGARKCKGHCLIVNIEVMLLVSVCITEDELLLLQTLKKNSYYVLS